MSKFNTSKAAPTGVSVITGERVASGRTHEGGAGYARDVQSELFLLAVTNMVGENTFYESAASRDNRFGELIRSAVGAGVDNDWFIPFATWLRSEANMRSASLVLAAEVVKARLDRNLFGNNRQIINAVLQRADEPGEMLAYWTSNYGRSVPKPVKRGVADAAARMYNERSFLKWDSNAHGYRFADVLSLTHPEPSATWQDALFKHILSVYHDSSTVPTAELSMLTANRELRSKKPEKIRKWAANGKLAEKLSEAGFAWEAVPSLVNGPWDAALWEAIIPSMGYMALLRNLRNFDQAGISEAAIDAVVARLTSPEEVARSRQLPMRFLSAYNAAPSLSWGRALDKAMDLSLNSIPRLDGRTLIMVDTSTSMKERFSERSDLHRWDAAAMFGLALARRCDSPEVVSFSSAQYWSHESPGAKTKVFEAKKGESLLRSIERWNNDGYFLGGGTDTPAALRQHFRSQKRVIVLTDEQAGSTRTARDVDAAIPASTPMYTMNLAGYKYGHAPSGSKNRHAFGGLTDSMLKLIPALEKGTGTSWPWTV